MFYCPERGEKVDAKVTRFFFNEYRIMFSKSITRSVLLMQDFIFLFSKESRPQSELPKLKMANRLLWRFHSEHISQGPFDGMPLLVHATPIERPGVNQFQYIIHLTTAMQVNIIALVKAYNRRNHTRILSQEEIM